MYDFSIYESYHRSSRRRVAYCSTSVKPRLHVNNGGNETPRNESENFVDSFQIHNKHKVMLIIYAATYRKDFHKKSSRIRSISSPRGRASRSFPDTYTTFYGRLDSLLPSQPTRRTLDRYRFLGAYLLRPGRRGEVL